MAGDLKVGSGQNSTGDSSALVGSAPKNASEADILKMQKLMQGSNDSSNNQSGALAQGGVQDGLANLKNLEPGASKIGANLGNLGESLGGQATAKGTMSDNSMSELSSIYSSLMSAWQNGTPTQFANQAGNQGQMGEGALTQAADDKSQLQDIANQVLERIQVSLPNATQGSEVRLSLGNALSQFAGTEIVLHRSADGSLAVEISCRNSEQVKKFASVKDEIKTSLEQLEDRPVAVTLGSAEDTDNAQDNFAQQYAAYSRSQTQHDGAYW